MPWNPSLRLPPPLDMIAKWKLEFNSPHQPDEDESAALFPLRVPEWELFMNSYDEMAVCWVGHSTLYVKMAGGIRILSDPVFSHRISPFPWFSPTRYVPVPFEIDQMPMPHIIMLSHDHYDHLDAPSIKAIEAHAKKIGEYPNYLVGLGLEKFLTEQFDINPDRITSFDWWQSTSLNFPKDHHETGQLTAQFVPAQHWSGRLGDNMERLWGGFVITDSAHQKFYFVGDTGWDEALFSEIAERIGPVDLAAIPIGAYKPRWFMRPQHIDPKEAHRIHQMVKSKFSIGIHWGTFILTDEAITEPKNRIEQIRQDAGDDGTNFIVLQHGQSIPIS